MKHQIYEIIYLHQRHSAALLHDTCTNEENTGKLLVVAEQGLWLLSRLTFKNLVVLYKLQLAHKALNTYSQLPTCTFTI